MFVSVLSVVSVICQPSIKYFNTYFHIDLYQLIVQFSLCFGSNFSWQIQLDHQLLELWRSSSVSKTQSLEAPLFKRVFYEEIGLIRLDASGCLDDADFSAEYSVDSSEFLTAKHFEFLNLAQQQNPPKLLLCFISSN